MKQKAIEVKTHWREIIAIMTLVVVAVSLMLISYGIRKNNEIADRQRQQINCIAKFYTKANRVNKVINNLDDCSIKQQ
jgi:hypothetical protein